GGHDAGRFHRAAIRELGHHRRADVDADESHPGGRHVPDADRVQHRGEHQDDLGAGEQARVLLLGAEEVHLSIGKRTIIPDRAGEGERHAPLDALVEDPSLDQPLADRLCDAAVAAYQVDHLQVVAVTALDAHPTLQVHPERGPEQALLEVVDGESIAAEECLDVAPTHEASQVGTAARVDHDRPGDHGDLPVPLVDAAQPPRDTLPPQLDPPRAAEPRSHELDGPDPRQPHRTTPGWVTPSRRARTSGRATRAPIWMSWVRIISSRSAEGATTRRRATES